MNKLYRRLAICAMGVACSTLPIASAQQYTTIDYPGAVATTLNGGPNPQGTSVGSYTDTGGVTHGFVLQKGKLTSFDPPGSTSTSPNMISPQGVIVGSYLDSSGASHGFILNSGNYTTVDFPGAAGTVLTSLNPSGELSGFTCNVASCLNPVINHSFVVSKKGTFSSFDPPGAISSGTSIVIESRAVFGFYVDSSGVEHGYELYHGTFTTIDPQGSVFTFVGGANPEGDSVGVYTDSSNVTHSFLLRNGVFTTFDPPDAVEQPFGFVSEATGINPSGVIVGVYVDSAGIEVGYIRTP